MIRGSTLTLGKVLWKKEDYAPFNEGATAEMKERILAELAELNYYKPTLKTTVVPVPSSRQGDLVIEMTDEGLKGTIDDFGFFYPIDGPAGLPRGAELVYQSRRPG